MPKAFYLDKLISICDRLLVILRGIMLVVVAGGALILRAVKRAEAQIENESGVYVAMEK